ncbi:ribonuclease P protein subunit p40-like [Anopheles nili]|uniref:ribonuclease P protein subunit p40-like n=1 Tax=Anopheles nili TaxID=185578 RepID=UPI00237C4AAD|nr:ribonuclease P protein subunit p40-like [Anopheles nili]
MLCPESWNLPIPSYRIENGENAKWTKSKIDSKVRKDVDAQQLNRSLCIVIPANEPQFVSELAHFLSNKTLLLVRQLPLHEILEKEFIEAFVKRGKLYAVTKKAKLETDNCAAITADGELMMSLNKETYECLETKLSSNLRSRTGEKYLIKIDLKSSTAINCIKNTTLAFDMILRWVPPSIEELKLANNSDLRVSCTSIEKYLSGFRGLTVERFPMNYKTITRNDEAIPLLNLSRNEPAPANGQNYCTYDELLEYIGLLVLDCELEPVEYLSNYMVDGCHRKTETTSILYAQGLFTPDDIACFIDQLIELVNECGGIPWVALHAQGFSNVPLREAAASESGLYWNHDSSYTAVITDQEQMLWSNVQGRSS